MRLLVVAAIFGVVGAGAAGCDSNSDASAPQPTHSTAASAQPSVTASVTPSGTPANLIEFTVDGAGPYQLGVSQASLQAAGNLDGVAPAGGTCADTTTAHGTGTWKDIQLSFHKDGKLYLAVNKSPSIPTPSGAWLGSTLPELKKIYAGVGGEELAKAPNSAYLVTTLTGRGILFDLGASQKVISMVAGDAAYLKTAYTAGTEFC